MARDGETTTRTRSPVQAPDWPSSTQLRSRSAFPNHRARESGRQDPRTAAHVDRGAAHPAGRPDSGGPPRPQLRRQPDAGGQRAEAPRPGTGRGMGAPARGVRQAALHPRIGPPLRGARGPRGLGGAPGCNPHHEGGSGPAHRDVPRAGSDPTRARLAAVHRVRPSLSPAPDRTGRQPVPGARHGRGEPDGLHLPDGPGPAPGGDDPGALGDPGGSSANRTRTPARRRCAPTCGGPSSAWIGRRTPRSARASAPAVARGARATPVDAAAKPSATPRRRGERSQTVHSQRDRFRSRRGVRV